MPKASKYGRCIKASLYIIQFNTIGLMKIIDLINLTPHAPEEDRLIKVYPYIIQLDSFTIMSQPIRADFGLIFGKRRGG
jgi:hypothetical protein